MRRQATAMLGIKVTTQNVTSVIGIARNRQASTMTHAIQIKTHAKT